MSTYFIEVSVEVIGQESNHYYEVDDGGVVGIRSVNNRYEVVFNNGRMLSIPAGQAILVCKEVTKDEYLANMNALHQPIIGKLL